MKGIVRCGADDFRELSREILASGACLRFQARGGSMQPVIRDGDILEVQPVAATDVNVGDVVFFYGRGGNVLAHRLVRKIWGQNGGLTLIAMGDAASRCDAPIHADLLLGRVVSIERQERTIRLDSGLRRLARSVWAGMPRVGFHLYRLWQRGHRKATGVAYKVAGLIDFAR